MAHTFTTFPTPLPVRLPRKAKVVVGVMVACALSGVLALAASSRRTPALPTAVLKWVGFATLVADNYVAGHEVAVPLANGLTSSLGRLSRVGAGLAQAPPGGASSPLDTVQPLGVTVVAFYAGVDRPAGKSDTLETDTFLLERPSGALEALDIVVEGTPAGPELAALPSLVPVPTAPKPSPEAGAPVPVGQLVTPLSAGVTYRVRQWATAYASNDAAVLYETTGDTAGQSYEGLGGYELVGAPTILASTQDGPKTPSQLVLTVELTLSPTADPNVIQEVAYDLLVTGVRDKYPNVVAWGPAGSGSTLTPYENAR